MTSHFMERCAVGSRSERRWPTGLGARAALLALILVCATASPSRADSQYCVTGLPEQPDQQFFEKVRSGCQVGDIIVLPAGFTGAIGLLCDFSRQIVLAADKVLCIKVETRETRTVR